MKFLVDTGANKNYLSPDHVNIENCKTETGIKVTNIKGTHSINRSASFDPFQINKKLKFFIFKFHNFFDGLIGYESLRDLNAQIDIRKNTLKIGRKTIQMKKRFPDNHRINITEQEFQFVKIKKKKDGDFLIKEEKHHENFTILPGLYKSENNLAFIAVQNHTKSPIEININQLQAKTEKCEIIKLPDADIASKKINYNIRDKHMNELEKDALKEVINKNRDVLYEESEKLTFTHKIKHSIRTTDNIPIHVKSYKCPQIFEAEIQKQVRKMLNDGIIKESISPYTAPVWVVPKKADASGVKKFRLVIDYRKLNEKTINDKYPIPDITDILDKLGRACYFSTVDLVSGFHQIQLSGEDTEKTAFSVNSGKYEFTRMPFGLKNAPATFQRVMDCILRDLIGVCCFVYMDDIIIFSSSLQEHKKHLDMILKRLKDAGLKIQLDKCEFFRKEVQFLGHTVSEDGVRPNEDKIKSIRSWPIPKNEKEVRQFLGTLGYYRRFIKDFAKLVKPLTSLLRKDKEFEITPEINECFQRCKQILIRDPILMYPDFSKDFILTTDASDYAIGAVLSQGTPGKDRPVAYASRTLNKTEERYSTTEKELLAIVWAVKHFKPYLYGRKFKLVTDHKPLIYSLTNTNDKIVRWKLNLGEFDYEIEYKPGKQNVIADALSRIRTETNEEVNVNTSSDDLETVHSADTSDDYFISCTERPINLFKTQLIFKIGNIDTDLHEEVFTKYHRYTIARPQYTEVDIVNIFKNYLNPKGVNCIKAPVSLLQLIQETYKTHFSTNKIFKVFISEKLLEDIRLDTEQDELIEQVHEFGHRGIKENKKQILQKYFFPELERKLKIFITSCDICKRSKYDRKPPKLIQRSTFGETVFDRIHIDVFFMKGHKWLTIVDSFSKFANIIALETRTIIDMKKAITDHIRQFGRPVTIVCDQEPSFKSIDFIGFLNDLGIVVHHASSSESNGIVERFHSTLIELYRTLHAKYKDLALNEIMNILTDIYNNTFHSAINQKPRDVVFNKTNITNSEEIARNFDKIQSAIKVELNKRKEAHENKFDKNETPKTLNINDKKYIKIGQRQTKDQNLYKIATVKSNDEFTFTDANDIKIHKNRIKN